MAGSSSCPASERCAARRQTDAAASHAAPHNGLQADEAHASQDSEDEVLERMMASASMGQSAATEDSSQVGTRLD